MLYKSNAVFAVPTYVNYIIIAVDRLSRVLVCYVDYAYWGNYNKKKRTSCNTLAFKQHGRCDIMSFNRHRWCGNLHDSAVII